MTERVEEMAHVIWSKGGAGLLMYDAIRIAEVLVAAGYERRRDVAEADALRKQVRG